ncbi:hypothetical protein LTR10_000657 [Elasticomyces elasticus]|nr:hypothetical protein LTR10_000657 [Elasticomyces elasticus]KAK4980094.1 hypothetical protein LTR42_000401 [Elasticomyces elasticus]
MRWSRLCLAAVPIIVHITNASPTPHEDGKISNVPLPVEKVATSHLLVAENVLPLRRTGLAAISSAVLRDASDASQNVTSILPVHKGVSYAIKISFGGKEFEVIIDTGSSDLWLPKRGVRCSGDDGTSTACNFGPLADPGFQDGGIANETFKIQFLDNTDTVGVLGYEDVGIGEITVRHQKVALVDQAHFDGFKVTSGLVGFGYPSHTSAYDLRGVHVPYKNWLFNAIDQKLIEPVFSLAIERGTDGGQLALGGLPTVPFDHTFASTPILKANPSSASHEASNYSAYGDYSIIPDGFDLNGQWHAYPSLSELVVDSGSTLMHIPRREASLINDAFHPPAKWNEKLQAYVLRCNAKPPSLAMKIGGASFPIKAEDMILSRSASLIPDMLPKGHCVSGIQESVLGVGVLGGTFLKNVVAVFDIGQGQMHFAPHDY